MSRTSSANSRTSRTAPKTPEFDIQDVPENPLTHAPNRTKRAKDYEQRLAGLMQMAMSGCAGNPATVADAAAIIEHGPIIASKAGDLADQDERVRKAIDFITSGSENPYLALVVATVPLVAQVLRNHESDVVKNVEVKVPFWKKRVRLPFKIKLRNPFLRSLTKEPDALNHKVFGQPEIMAALQEQSINVAWEGGRKA